MKKIILSLLFICMTTLVLFGQTSRKSVEQSQPAPSEEPISDEAREKMREIKKRGAELRQQIMDDKSLSAEQRKVKLRELKKSQEKEREQIVGKNKAGEIRGNRKDYRSKHPNGTKKPQARPEREKKVEEGQPR